MLLRVHPPAQALVPLAPAAGAQAGAVGARLGACRLSWDTQRTRGTSTCPGRSPTECHGGAQERGLGQIWAGQQAPRVLKMRTSPWWLPAQKEPHVLRAVGVGGQRWVVLPWGFQAGCGANRDLDRSKDTYRTSQCHPDESWPSLDHRSQAGEDGQTDGWTEGGKICPSNNQAGRHARELTDGM